MNFMGQQTGNVDAYYEPNSMNGAAENPSYREPPLKISGDADRYDHRDGNDDYVQVTALFNLFDGGQKNRLYSNIADAMAGVPANIVERQCVHFDRVHADYGKGVRQAIAAKSKMSEAAE